MTELHGVAFAAALAAAFLTAASKTCMPGIGIIVAVPTAFFVPSGVSTGLMLPLLLLGDIIAFREYGHAVSPEQAGKMLLSALAGIVAGGVVAATVGFERFEFPLGVLVLGFLALELYRRTQPELEYRSWVGTVGLFAAGAAAVGSSAAGAILAVCLLGNGMRKEQMLGSSACFFLTANVLKAPFGIYYGAVPWRAFMSLDCLWLLLACLAGTAAGVRASAKLKQSWFDFFVLLLSGLSGLWLLAGGSLLPL